MGKRAFYWSWVKGTFSRSLGWGDLVGSLVGTALTTASHFNPEWVPIFDGVKWKIAVFAIVGALAFRAFLVPYELWQTQKDRADALPPEQRAFDVKLWSDEHVLRLYQAACLWVEKTPPASSNEPIPVEARPILQRLKRAITSKNLPFHDDVDGKKWLMTCAQPVAQLFGVKASTPIEISNRAEIDRDGLRSYAHQIGERPRFLFED